MTARSAANTPWLRQRIPGMACLLMVVLWLLTACQSTRTPTSLSAPPNTPAIDAADTPRKLDREPAITAPAHSDASTEPSPSEQSAPTALNDSDGVSTPPLSQADSSDAQTSPALDAATASLDADSADADAADEPQTDAGSGNAQLPHDQVPVPPPHRLVQTPVRTGTLQHAELVEASGLAASRRHDNVLYLINDSGNGSTLYAVSETGQTLGVWPVDAKAHDWEDMTSARVNDEAFLLIADVGDNLRNRPYNRLHILSEPDLPTDQISGPTLSPVRTLRFQYPGRRHDSEAVSTDGQWIYILTKGNPNSTDDQLSHVYRLPFPADTEEAEDDVITAEFLGMLPTRSHTLETGLIASLAGVDFRQPTAFEISPDNRYAFILTYRHVLRIVRTGEQDWSDALLAGSQRIHTHKLPQGEALTVHADNGVWFTSEKNAAPLWALPPPER